MEMIEWGRLLPGLLASLLGGGLIGLVYFGGLWVTIRYVTEKQGANWLLLASFAGRAVVAVAAFVWLVNGRLPDLIATLIGFFLMRTILIRRLGLKNSA
jgi:F1F0 ATPase subunit 2